MASPLNKAHLFLYLALICLIILPSTAVASALPGCPDKCGNINIPYPFGTSPQCRRNGFNITCDESTTPPTALFGSKSSTIELIDINISSGEARIYKKIGYRCYNSSDSVYDDNNDAAINIRPLKPFLFSNRRNKFTAIGCKTLAYISSPNIQSNRNQSYFSGCVSFCGSLNETTGDGGLCNGLGCCQTSIPEELAYYKINWGFINNSASFINPCMYAVLVEEDWYKFQRQDLKGKNFLERTDKGSVPIVLDWAIRDNGTCLDTDMEKKPHSACLSENSRCYNTSNGAGYICNCMQGYEGNPYFRNGCTDIDECKPSHMYPCYGICINTEGSFECVCPSGTKGNGKINCIQIPLISPVLARVLIASGAGIATLVVICILVFVFRWWRRYKKEKQLYQNYYKMMDNQLRVFSKRKIEIATNNFDENYVLGSGGRGKVFKGVFDNNKTVAIKMSKEVEESQKEEFVNEIILLSQINHKNIVTLLGCCLEVKIPMLVYELVPNGTLFELLHGNSKNRPIPLAARLKIALESAEALDYLHTSISRPIIHGDVKSANILLDDGYCAKVSDFGASNIVPTDNTQVVELFQWTVGYLDPECLCSQIVTKSSDVYSFGVVILELVTRKKAIYKDESDQRLHLASQFVSMMSNGELNEILDKEIVTNDDIVIEVLQEISGLAVWCLSAAGDNRPTMRQVVEKLQQLVRMIGILPCVQIDPEESQSLLGEPTFYTASSDTTIFPSTECGTVLEIDTGSTS